MRAILLIEVLALMLGHAAGVLLSDRTPEQQQAIEDIQDRMETFHYLGQDRW